MPQDVGVPPCGSAGCPVCAIRQRLLDGGAVEFAEATLFDEDTPGDDYCEVTICDRGNCSCQTRLKMDSKGASYRQKPQSSDDTPMCDCAVIGALPGRNIAIAIELKFGAATWEDVEPQLKAALRVLRDEFDMVSADSAPRAYLVVGKERDEMQAFLDASAIRLSYGPVEVPVEVIDCVSCVDVSAL